MWEEGKGSFIVSRLLFIRYSYVLDLEILGCGY